MTSCAVKRHILTSMTLASLTQFTYTVKGTNYFVKNLVITNPVSIAYRAPKKNVSCPERIPTCHHYEIKGHIQLHYNKLQNLKNQTQ